MRKHIAVVQAPGLRQIEHFVALGPAMTAIRAGRGLFWEFFRHLRLVSSQAE
jgi:hypothetical protein